MAVEFLTSEKRSNNLMMESTQAFYSTSLLFRISSLKQTDSKITILYFFSFLESNHNAHTPHLVS